MAVGDLHSTSDGGSVPLPDPTLATHDALERAVRSERDYVAGQIGVLAERLDAMDKATALLSETVNRVPTVVQTEVQHVRELIEEKFSSIGTQFSERDTRQEREARDNKVAVDAAFAAQKEAAAQQDIANQKAIDKSEKSTAETINKLQDLFETRTKGLEDKIQDTKGRLDRGEGGVSGAKDWRTEHRLDSGTIISVVAVLVSVLAIVAVVVSATIR